MSCLMYRSFVFSIYFFDLLIPAGADLGQVVCPENADHVHHQGEGDHQLDGGRNELTGAQGDTANNDNRLLDALTTQGGEQGRDDAIREGRKKAGNDRPEVERSGQDNDVLGIKHISLS